jgi:hypothetical protein
MSNFIDDIPRMLPTNFRFIWQSGFREEDFLEINQSETRIAFGGHVVSDWLISKKKSSPLKPLGQMNRNLVGSILGKSFIKIDNLVPIR